MDLSAVAVGYCDTPQADGTSKKRLIVLKLDFNQDLEPCITIKWS